MISVIVPVYNVEKFLNYCVNSIVNQTYNDLEIILIDDGSTDNSGKICDEWLERDERVKVIHQKNMGLSGARNSGIDLASGDYIAFIDSDDFILPEYFHYLLDLIESQDADISVCQLLEVDEENNVIKEKNICRSYDLNNNYECMRDFLSSNVIDTTAWRKLYRSRLFKESGIRYPLGAYNEDVFTTYKVISECDRIAVGSKALYAYRKREGSIMNSTFNQKHLDGVRGKIERLDFIKEKYPELAKLAVPGIIHSANQCVIRMINSMNTSLEAKKYLQNIYRTYGGEYIRSKNAFYKKCFVALACLNLNALLKLGNIANKLHS